MKNVTPPSEVQKCDCPVSVNNYGRSFSDGKRTKCIPTRLLCNHTFEVHGGPVFCIVYCTEYPPNPPPLFPINHHPSLTTPAPKWSVLKQHHKLKQKQNSKIITIPITTVWKNRLVYYF